jgi:chromosome partitioning protein
MKTITVANHKGGVAKTTTAVTAAQGLAMRGHSVLLVDTDAQGQCAPMLGLDKADDLFNLLIAKKHLADCTVYTDNEPLVAIIRSHNETATAKSVLSASYPPAPIDTLARRLQPAADVIDYCIIDTAPSLDSLFLGTLWAADYVIVPTLCEKLSLQGLLHVLSTLQILHHDYAANTKLLGILPTKYRISTNEHRRNLKRLTDAYGRTVWPAIPISTSIPEASSYAMSLWDYDPRGKATIRYTRAVELLINGTR